MGGDATRLAGDEGRQQANGKGSKSKHDDAAIDGGERVICVLVLDEMPKKVYLVVDKKGCGRGRLGTAATMGIYRHWGMGSIPTSYSSLCSCAPFKNLVRHLNFITTAALAQYRCEGLA